MPEARTRMTRQRAEILAELRKARNHPTAEEIHARVRRSLPRISLGTVYRNLELLAQSGEILRLEGGNGGRRFAGDISPHHAGAGRAEGGGFCHPAGAHRTRRRVRPMRGGRAGFVDRNTAGRYARPGDLP